MKKVYFSVCLCVIAGFSANWFWLSSPAEESQAVIYGVYENIEPQPFTQSNYFEPNIAPPTPTSPLVSLQSTGLSEQEINQRFSGLLSHVRWLMDRSSKVGETVSSESLTSQVDLIERQLFHFMDEAHDDDRDIRDDIADDLSSLSIDLTTDTTFTNPTFTDATATGTFYVNGNLGVGTSSPSDTLAVAGAIYLDAVAPANTASRLYNLGGSLYFDGTPVSAGSGSGTVLPSATAGALAYYPTATSTVDDASGLTWDNALGRLGIATTSPSAPLSVTGDALITGNIFGATWNGATIADSYINDNITVSNYLALTDWFATTTQANISSLPSLTVTESQISDLSHYTSSDFATDFLATTTDTLTEGSNNIYSQWSNAGSDIFFTGGNVGIGTSSTQYSLDIDGDDVRIYGSLGNSGLVTERGGGGSASVFASGLFRSLIKFDENFEFVISSDSRANILDPAGIGTNRFTINGLSGAVNIPGSLSIGGAITGAADWNGNPITDAYVNDNITASNYLQLTSWYATTTQANITSLPSLSITESQISDLSHYTSSDFFSDFSATTTDTLTQGTNNLYSQWGNTGSDIYFTGGNVGIGTTSPNDTLAVESNYIESIGFNGERAVTKNLLNLSCPGCGSNPNATFFGTNNELVTSAESFGGQTLIGTRNEVDVNGSFSLGEAFGVVNEISASGGNLYGIRNSINASGSTVVYASHNIISGNPLIATGVYVGDVSGSLFGSYGLFLADQTAATGAASKYAIYSEGGKSYFGGNVGIGTTSPYAKLSVVGDAVITGNLTAGGFTATSSVSAPYFTATDTNATSTFAGNVDINNHAAVGQGASINADQILKVSETTTDPTNNQSGVYSQPVVSGDASNFDHHGVVGAPSITLTTANATGDLIGVLGAPWWNPGGVHTLTSLVGVAGRIVITGGTVTDSYGIQSDPFILGGTSTNVYGLYAKNPLNIAVLTNNYGLYIEDQTAGTNNYSIYSAGGTNYFGGNLGIGTTSPLALLTIGSSTPGSIAAGNLYNSAYVSGDLEVDGTLYGTVNPGLTTNQVVYGGATGGLSQDADFQWVEATNVLNLGSASAGRVNLTTNNGYGFTQIGPTATLSTYIDASGGWLGTVTDDPLHFFTNDSSSKMTLTSAGNLGLGTTVLSPQALLNIGSGGATPHIRLTTIVGTSEVDIKTDVSRFFINTNVGSDSLDFVVNTGATGKMGINDLFPDALLEINASSSALDLFMLSSALSDDGDLFVVKNSGNVGIGTTTPNAKLTVAGDINIDDGSSGLSILGTRVFYSSTTNDSIAIGELAGDTFNSGTTYNVALGFEAGRYASTSGSDFNNFIGWQAGQNNTGNLNNLLGLQAGYNNTGNYNNLFGVSAGQNNTGDNNNIIGEGAGYNNVGHFSNLIGQEAGYNNNGNFNEMIGYQTGFHLQSNNSVAIGGWALHGAFHWSNYISDNNVALGVRAGYASDDGSGNNILIGYQAADNLTTGNNNIIIGYDIDNTTAGASNVLNIGNLIFGTGVDGTGTTLSSGNVGIGTSSPYAKLSVAGDAVITGNLTAGGFTASSSISAPYFTATDANATSTFANHVSIADAKSYRVGGVPIIYFNSNGGLTNQLRVGQGNSVSSLDTTAIGQANTVSSTGGAGFGYLNTATGAGGAAAFGISNTASNIFSSAFGHSNTASNLSASAFGRSNNVSGSGASAFGFSNSVSGSGASAFGSFITNAVADSVMIGTSDSAKLTILSSGNVGIGTTTPNSLLTVAGDTNVSDPTSNLSGYFINQMPAVTGSTTLNNFFLAGASSTSFTSGATYNYAIGDNALTNLTTGDNNFAVGRDALAGSSTAGMSGSQNNALGFQSLSNNTTGSYNNALGAVALISNTTGSYNNALGWQSLSANTTGSWNNALGSQSLRFNTSGDNNNALGNWSNYSNTTGSHNNTLGYWSQLLNTTGSYNNVFGYHAGLSNTTGNYNNVFGYQALDSNNGTGTIAIGYRAAENAASVDRGIFIGYDIDAFSTTDDDVLNIGNLIFGTGVDGTGTTYSSGNVGIGTSSPYAKLSVAGDAVITGNLTAGGFTATSSISAPYFTATDANATSTFAGNVVVDKDISFVPGLFSTPDNDGNNVGWKVKLWNQSSFSFGHGIGISQLWASVPAGGSHTFFVDETERLRLNSVGNLGLGDISPDSRFEVSADGGLSDLFMLSSDDNSDGDLFVVKNSGNIGIGTTTPNSLLTVAGDANVSDSTSNLAGYFINQMPAVTGSTTLNNFFLAGASSTNFTFGATYNYAIGDNALTNLTTGSNNFAVGRDALAGSSTAGMSGSQNNALGYQALFNNTFGANNNALGGFALISNTSGSHNNALGFSSLPANTTGSHNNSFGNNSLLSNTTGTNNNSMGSASLFSNITGSYNNAFGGSLFFNTTGSYNNSFGPSSLFSNTTGSYNNAFGYQALYTNNGTGTIAIGYRAADNAVAVDRGIFIGYDVDAFSAADDVLNIGNLIFGTGVDGTGTTYSSGNVGIGTSSPYAKLSVVGEVVASNFTGTSSLPSSFGGNLSVDGHLAVGSGTLVNSNVVATVAEAFASPSFPKIGISGSLSLSGNLGSWNYAGADFSPSASSITANATGDLIGASASPTWNPGGAYTLGELVSFSASPSGNSGTVSDTYGFRSSPFVNGATMTDVFGFYAKDPLVSSGSITNNYGLYLEDQTAGTNNYSIYSAGGTNYFAGNVGIGTTSPLAKLSVNYVDGLDTGPRFLVGSSTAPNFIVDEDGHIGIGTTTVPSLMTIDGAGLANSVDLVKVTAPAGYPGGAGSYFKMVDSNGSTKFQINSYGNFNAYAGASFTGSVGASPGNGNILLTPASSQNGLTMKSGAAYSGDYIRILDTSNKYLLTFDSSGSFGIGTSSPHAKLSVMQTSGGTDPLFIVASSTSGAGTSTALIIDHLGNVGIGSSTPGYKLAVVGNVYASSFIDDGITIGAPDYVFDDPAYNHLTIQEIEAFIEENDHLPWLTPRGPGPMALSARINEVLEGLENLFLKVFELVDWNEEQDLEINALKEQNAFLMNRLEQIESELDVETSSEPIEESVGDEPIDETPIEPEPEPEPPTDEPDTTEDPVDDEPTEETPLDTEPPTEESPVDEPEVTEATPDPVAEEVTPEEEAPVEEIIEEPTPEPEAPAEVLVETPPETEE